jgi:hypothetical protein
MTAMEHRGGADLVVRPLDQERDLDGFLRVLYEEEPLPRTANE